MTEIKRGMLKYYHRGLLNKKWKDYKCILYDSSLFTWYSDIKHKKPDGMVLLKDIERFICVGPYTKCLPDFPHLDDECDQIALIAFPMSVQNRDRDITWLLCEDIEDLNSWMKAIVQTLPSHTLLMENRTKVSSPMITDDISNNLETNLTQSASHASPIIKMGSIGLPLAAGLIGNRLQGHSMNTKSNPLSKVGYDYGDTMWGTGEGWGHFSSLTVPGFAGLGGNGCYSNHIDLIRNEDDEKRLKEAEEQTTGMLDDEEAVDVAQDELSKNKYNEISFDHENKKDSDRESTNSDDSAARELEERMEMIDDELEE